MKYNIAESRLWEEEVRINSFLGGSILAGGRVAQRRWPRGEGVVDEVCQVLAMG